MSRSWPEEQQPTPEQQPDADVVAMLQAATEPTPGPQEPSRRERGGLGRLVARPEALLCIIIAMVCLSSACWLLIDQRPPDGDTPTHMGKCYNHLQIWSAESSWAERYRLATCYESVFPPLLYALVAMACKVQGGYTVHGSLRLHVALWPILLVYTWRLGTLLRGSTPGLWAAVAVGASPLLVLLGHKMYPEFLQATLVTAALVHLLASEGFDRREHAWMAGVCLGLGMLVKWTTAAYLGGALLVTGVRALASSFQRPTALRLGLLAATAAWLALAVRQSLALVRYPGVEVDFWLLERQVLVTSLSLLVVSEALVRAFGDEAPRPWLRGVQALAIVWLIAGPWYLWHGAGLRSYLPQVSYEAGIGEDDPRPGTLASIIFYPLALHYGQHAMLSVLMLAGLLLAAVRACRGDLGAASVVSTLAIAFLAFTGVVNKETRYILPILPALLAMTLFPSPSWGRAHRPAAAALLLLFGLQLWGWAFEATWLERIGLTHLRQDDLSAGALNLPGTHHHAAATWGAFATNPHIPLLGMRPVRMRFDDTTVYRDTGP